MKHIVSISLGSSQRDYSFVTTLLGQDMHVQRLGADGDLSRAAALVRAYDGRVQAICLDGLTPVLRVGTARYRHPEAVKIAAQSRHTPVVDGSVLKGTLERWVVKRAAELLPGIFRYRRVLLTSGIARYQLAHALTEYDVELRCADPIIHFGFPLLPTPRSLAQLELYAAIVLPLATLLSFRVLHPATTAPDQAHRCLYKLFDWADVIVGDFDTIRRLAPADLRGRTLVTDDPSPDEIEDLRRRGVATLVTMTPPLSQTRPFVTTAMLEGMIAALQARGEQPGEAEVLDVIDAAGWEPTILHLNDIQATPRFAFVIHPLKTNHIYNDARFAFARYLPQRLVEWAAAFAPPIYLSRMRGIRSMTTGKQVEGILLTLGATPREMMRRRPAFTYRRLIRAARMAERMGAKIMGLGAFTSVVGDAGITVAQKCEIGITTGNSLTVAATLEAAKRAVVLMGGRPDQGRAVVIGATGSIGSVCARLLALAIRDVVLVAPRPERLLALKKMIEREVPEARITIATRPDAYLGDADLIVTTTNALTGRVINIDRLKPGAVVCDVARPPDVRAEDAARRPDVLVIESGEILLPGEPDLGFDIGLPPGTVYACLAETVLLAMEGWCEDYTLGRNIEIERVKEMYRLMKKHGMDLAGLRSFGRYISDEDIAEKRRLADARRGRLAVPVECTVIAEVG